MASSRPVVAPGRSERCSRERAAPDPRRVAQSLGIPADAVSTVEVLSERHGQRLWRLGAGSRSFVLKWLPLAAARVEVGAYRLLHFMGVPTLALLASNEQALLLDDVERSDIWRLANEQDAADEDVARALAAWYRTFHDAGAALVAHGVAPAYLRRESGALERAALQTAGRRLGLDCEPGWGRALAAVPPLRAALERCETTLNHNDFFWTNVALARRGDRALVFDYHLLGIGTRAGDVRNVTSSLATDAAEAFREAYGPLDEAAVLLDRPLATLHALVVAARLPAVPRWAEASLEEVRRGDLDAAVEAALPLVANHDAPGAPLPYRRARQGMRRRGP